MSEQQFDIYFSGKILPEQEPELVKQRLGQLFRLSGTGLERLFSGTPVRIKQGVDAETAKRYQETLRKAGAVAELRYPEQASEADAPTQPSSPSTAQAEESHNSTVPVSDASDSDLSLAVAGADMDDTPPPPALEVDTSGLSADPANSGSLEDCVWEKPAVPIPDISQLSLEDN